MQKKGLKVTGSILHKCATVGELIILTEIVGLYECLRDQEPSMVSVTLHELAVIMDATLPTVYRAIDNLVKNEIIGSYKKRVDDKYKVYYELLDQSLVESHGFTWLVK
jgi:DNA-binding MarR family transcriptional regulator